MRAYRDISPTSTVARSRSYYYLAADGKLEREVVPYRAHKRYKIPKTVDSKSLVVVIEYDGDRTRVIEEGPLYNARLEQLAILREFGVEPSSDPSSRAMITSGVLASFVDIVRARVNDAVQRIEANWRNVGGETDMVPLLLDRLHFTEQRADWTLSIRPQVFSSQTKEPYAGADLAWVIQIRIGSTNPLRTTKAIWMQAKKTNHDINKPSDIWVLPDFEQQFAAMKRRTSEAFGLVFAPERIVTGDENQIQSLDRLFQDVITCVRGDQREQVIAESVDRHYLVIANMVRPRRRPQHGANRRPRT